MQSQFDNILERLERLEEEVVDLVAENYRVGEKKPPSIDRKELNCRFTYHKPKGWQPAVYGLLRDLAGEFASRINRMCPESREKSLAITKIEEAVFWANAAVARRGGERWKTDGRTDQRR